MEDSIKNLKSENLKRLDVSELKSEYLLQKLLDWQEEYDWVDWLEFKEYWSKCNRCKSYTEGSCICYAR